MSSYYRPESVAQSFSNYMYIGSMSCNLQSTPLGSQSCPEQTIDFNRTVAAASPASVVQTMSGPGYNALGSAYPNILSMPFKLYQDTKY